MLVSPAVLVAAFLLAAPAAGPASELENVAAFARLYGVLRYFYPSDTAAGLDWNRFAVLGVRRVRGASDPAELGASLQRLVAPLGPGIEIGPSLAPTPVSGSSGEPLVAWRYLGAGFSAMGGPYRAKRTHRAPPIQTDGFTTMRQTVPAADLRGKTIRLRALVRATAAGADGHGALWLRVDRAGQTMGFFDNMDDRPIRDPEWRTYVVEGPVADDATYVTFGVMVIGAATADFDAVELAVKGSTGDWTPFPVPDAGFEAAGEKKTSAWLRTGGASVSRPSQGAPEGERYLRFAPPSANPVDVELFPEGAPATGAHVDLELGSGLQARVPLALTDSEARPAPGSQEEGEALMAELGRVRDPSQKLDAERRLADVVVVWSTLRHFYPYFSEAGVDWETRLRPGLAAAAAAETRTDQREALQSLVADIRDGHGSVTDTLERSERGELPVRLTVVEGRLAVTSSATPSKVPVGALVLAIDGVPAAERVAHEAALVSGSPQWRQVKAIWALSAGSKGHEVDLSIDAGDGPREVSLSYGAPRPPAPRPEPVAEMEPDLWYVDLTRATMADVAPRQEALATASRVVFDLRGYPTDAGIGILPFLLDAPETDRWMHVAKIVGPFYETAGWHDQGWDLEPKEPHFAGTIVFLTDGTAISYAESVMGYVADRELGTIVGGTTAGANGNVASFPTPGGFGVSFTGMKVTGHDGHSPHHLVGVAPDVPVEPTLAGLRAGRDEVLERGLAIARTPADVLSETRAEGGEVMKRRSFVAAGMMLASRPVLAAAEEGGERHLPEAGASTERVRVGMAQIRVRTGAVDENLARAEAAIGKAKTLGCDVVVLPECLDLGWTNPESRRLAAPIPGPPSERLAAAARRNAIHVVAGLHERAGDRLYNASVLLDDHGRLVLKHHKINELDIAWDLYTRGDSLSVAHTRLGPVAISICADNSPASIALGHAAGLMGARMILSPCAWAVEPDYDAQKEPYGWDVWDVSYPTIARERQMTVIGVSGVGLMEAGPWKGRLCIGSSLAVGRYGNVLARGPYGVDAEALLTVDVPADRQSGPA